MHAWGGGLEDGRDSLLSAEEATYTDGFDSGFFHTMSSFGVCRQFFYQVTYLIEKSFVSQYT